jgi:hypothetical protein
MCVRAPRRGHVFTPAEQTETSCLSKLRSASIQLVFMEADYTILSKQLIGMARRLTDSHLLFQSQKGIGRGKVLFICPCCQNMRAK